MELKLCLELNCVHRAMMETSAFIEFSWYLSSMDLMGQLSVSQPGCPKWALILPTPQNVN